MIKSMWLIETSDRRIEKPAFKERYGSLIEELDLKRDYFCRYYYPIYMIRRTFYAIALVGADGLPYPQLILIPVFLGFPVC